MKQNTKDWIQYSSAVAMILSAIGLAIWSFNSLSEIHSTVLGYVGEAIAFAAAVYGIALYTKNEIKNELRKMRGEDAAEEES